MKQSSPRPPHFEMPVSRRDFLARSGGGFGALALTWLLNPLNTAAATSPVASHPGHLPGKAKNVIFIFVEGGPSHIDLVDPKPTLNKLAGQPLPDSFAPVITAMGEARSPLLECKRAWKQHGQSGLWFSNWLPHMANHADDFCVIRSCVADGLNHVGSVCQMNTGSMLAGRPSLGSWVTYGLGSENQNLPAFMVILDNPTLPHGASRNWGTGFMPATYQGTQLQDGNQPIPNLNPPQEVDARRQQNKLRLLSKLNRQHAASRSTQSDLEARINAYELAFRMQMEAPPAVDLSHETAQTKTLYGLDDESTAGMAKSCLLARRLVERGVRFVQIFCGSGSKWDAHSNIEGNHSTRCAASDQPVAALLHDLKQRGMLDETLVVWGGEFGRTPMSEKGDGRDHNPFGFSMLLAGGGVKGGQTIGSTDELGLHAVEDRVHVHDLHATILHALGLNARKLTYKNNGREENPVINSGDPVFKVFA